MSRPVRWGIVGLGRISNVIAGACKEASEAALAAVCSRSADKAKDFAARYGARAAYRSFTEMLADRELDAVYICTPNALHAPHAVEAARAGKHVFCEKPMAVTPGDCLTMIDACRAAGVLLGVGYHLRQHGVHREIRRLVAEGFLGEPMLARAHFFVGTQYDRSGWKSEHDVAGGGALMSAGVHSIDTLRYVLGREVAEVTSLADSQPIEEVAACLLRFEGGCIAYLDTSRVIPFASKQNDIVVYGSTASAAGLGTLGGRPTGRLEITTTEGTAGQDFTGQSLYQAEIEEFSLCIRSGGEPAANGTDGLRAAEITAALYDSLRGLGPVRLRPQTAASARETESSRGRLAR